MKLKDLQSNFTTPEQSLKLLEMGFSASTADCYFDSWDQIRWRILGDLDENFFEKYPQYIPSWSVGRLIALINNHSSTMPILCYQMAYNTRHKNSLIEIVLQFIQDNKEDINFKNMK